jgi:beta-glucosidase/6-phospho-beta-glucosidase/beta-galactosidase
MRLKKIGRSIDTPRPPAQPPCPDSAADYSPPHRQKRRQTPTNPDTVQHSSRWLRRIMNPVKTPFLGAFESVYLPGHGLDVAERTGHVASWQGDVEPLLEAGVTRLRYPLRWHRIEPEPGRFDWGATDEVLTYLRDHGIEPIVDLVHHTSYPEWLADGFRDRQFGPAYVGYATAVAERYPWLQSYTLFNEPFATLFLSGHEAIWPPYDSGVDGLVRLLNNVLPAVSRASQIWNELLPNAKHVWVDTCEHHVGSGESAQYAELANDRRHVALDLALGRHLDPARPFLSALLRAGGHPLLDIEPIRVDVIGLDYYCHSEWSYDEEGAHAPSRRPLGFAAIAQQYSDRYGLPMLLSETNLRGLPSDRASWLRYTLEQYEIAVERGVPLQGFCWFPSLDSCDWDSLLASPAGHVDPVGVVSLGRGMERTRTLFTQVWEDAASGVRAEDLPAYRFQPPCDELLAGFMPQMAHWPWQEPPADEWVEPVRVTDAETMSAWTVRVDGTSLPTPTHGAAIATSLEEAAQTELARELQQAHRRGVGAAVEGLRDAALGPVRLAGPAVPQLAAAAVSSATPFLRAPLLNRVSAALRLHPPGGDGDGLCLSCGTVAPCETAKILRS